MAGTPSDDEAIGARPGLADAIRQALRTLGLVTRERPALIAAVAGLSLVAALLPPAALYMSKLVIDGVVSAMQDGTEVSRNQALFWVVIESAILAALLAVRRFQVFAKAQLHAELGFVVSGLILERADRLSLRQIEDADIQQKLILAKQFAASRPYSLVNRIFDAAQHGLTLVSLLILLAVYAPWLVLLVVLGGLPVFIGNLRFSGDAYRFYTGRTPQMRERNYLESLVTNEASARERLHYGYGEAVRDRFGDLFRTLHGDDRSLQLRQASIGSGLSLAGSAVFLGGKLWIVAVTIAGAFTLGQMTMLVGLLKQGQAGVTNLLSAFTGGVEDVLYVTNLYALLDLPDAPEGRGLKSGPAPGEGLVFDGVSFTYPGSDRPALDDVSFSLPPGTRLGLVGANGSGKTTLVKLATGLYAPDAGEVRLDGLALQDWDRAALRHRIGVLFQPHVNYKLSLRDNVEAGSGFATVAGERLERAIEAGLAAELVTSLPGGLDTRLSKRFLDGIELSGGQWQRLAMARAHINDEADILIMDEPTAAMDPAAEADFMQRDLGGRSLVLISHRLANIRTADRIVMLDKGRVVECGAHEALIAEGGAYARLFATQAEPYRST